MKSILIELLIGLSKDEMKKFEYFIQNKYFNTDSVVVELYAYFKKNSKKLNSAYVLNDEVKLQIYQHILPKEKDISKSLNDKQKAYLTAKIGLLTNAIKQFLAVEALQEDKAFQYILLHKKLLEKRQFYTLEKSIKKQKKALLQQEERGGEYYFEALQVELVILGFLYQQGKIFKQDNLPELTQNFDTYYLIKQLDFHLTALSLIGASGSKSYNFERFDIISNLIRLPQYANHPLIKSYQLAIDMMQNDSQVAYDELLLWIQDNLAIIPRNNLIDFYKLATSFCARRIKEGKEEYYRHRFEIYKIMAREGLLVDNNFIPISFLKNMIGSACRVGEFDWAKDMLEKYRTFIRTEVREQTYHYNCAVIEFHQKNYKQSIHHCIRVHRVNPIYNINCRMVELKAYYELDEEYSEATIQGFDTTMQTVRSHKRLSNQDKKAWGNFLNIAKGLYKIKHQSGKTTREGLQKKLAGFEMINEKGWLLEKMGELG